MKTLKLILVITILLLVINTQGQDIFDALRNGDLVKVKELVENDLQILNSKNARQSTPLHVAAAYDNEIIAKYLIEKSSDIDAINGNFYTPLMFAGINVTKLLVAKGANINYKSQNGWSAIAEALWRGKKDVVEYLLENGLIIPDINSQEGKDRLFAALKIGSIKYLDRCLQLGLNPLFESESKSNLVHFAAESNSVELVTKLIDLGVPVDKKNIYSWKPLHVAVYNGNKSVVELLIQKGLDKNERTISGKSPYNIASESNMQEVMNYLDSISVDKSPQKFPVLKGDYLGQPKPGKKAEPFAPEIVSAQLNYHSCIVFSPDGNELYGKSMMPMSFIFSKRIDGNWTNPDTLKNMNYNDAPFISPDGKKFYYIAMQFVQGQPNESIYAMDKTTTGWSEPYPLPDIINSVPGIHWQMSVDGKGNLYFGARQNGTVSSRIYYSEFENGKYSEPRIIDELKDIDAHSPYISPDGSYLIISTPTHGMQILFRKNDGSWTNGKSITEIIGCEGHCPMVTHDGKYMFFLHNVGDKFIPYWVDARFIEELRPKE